MRACLSLAGKVPDEKELLIIWVRGSARSSMLLAMREPENSSDPLEYLFRRNWAMRVISPGKVGNRKIDLKGK